MLRSLLIFSDGGHFLFSKNLDQDNLEDGNPNLISSLLSAINMFANSIKAGDINSIEMKNYTLVGKKSSDYNIRFVSIIDAGDKVQECRKFLETCEKSFVDKFAIALQKFQSGEMLNTDMFKAWEPDLDCITSEVDFSPIQSVMEDIIKDISSQFNTKKLNEIPQVNQMEKIEPQVKENQEEQIIILEFPPIKQDPTKKDNKPIKKRVKKKSKKIKSKKTKKISKKKKKPELKKVKQKKKSKKQKKTSKKKKGKKK